MRQGAVCILAALVAGCASFDGSGLVPGKSTESEVRALMGSPSQTLELTGGEKALYYSRLPEGRMVFVATIGQDGVLRQFEQRLTRQNIAWLQAGTSTRDDVLGFFGPPGMAGRYPRLEREWWEYKYFDYQDRRILTVQFSPDGIVREVYDMRDWAFEPSGRASKGHH